MPAFGSIVLAVLSASWDTSAAAVLSADKQFSAAAALVDYPMCSTSGYEAALRNMYNDAQAPSPIFSTTLTHEFMQYDDEAVDVAKGLPGMT
jgi:hypothetical protein